MLINGIFFEVEKEYIKFLYDARLDEPDNRVKPFLKLPRYFQWLKFTRNSQQLSQKTVAAKIGIGVPSYSAIERREEFGLVTLETLAKCAAAMDCEIVYAIRRKDKQLPSAPIWQQILPHVKPQRTYHAFAHAKALFYNPKFRKKMKWAPFATPKPCGVRPARRQSFFF